MTATTGPEAAAWQEARRDAVGASEAAAVVGLSPFCSPLELYLIKRGEAPPKPETEAMRWGKVLEADIAAEYARRTGQALRRIPGNRRSVARPWMLASADREIVKDARGRGVYEGKALSAWTKLDDGLPDWVYVQVQQTMFVYGCEWAGIAILLGGQKLVVREATLDLELIDMLADAEAEFLKRVRLADPPPADGMAATGNLLRRLYPVGSGAVIVLDDFEALAAARRLLALKEAARPGEQEIEAIKQRFQALMGEAEEAIIPGFGRLSWRTFTPAPEPVLDAEGFKAEHPDLYAQFVTEKAKRPYRRFLTHPLKEESDDNSTD